MAIDYNRLIEEIDNEIARLKQELSDAERVRIWALRHKTPESDHYRDMPNGSSRRRIRAPSDEDTVENSNKKAPSIILRDAQLKALELLGEYVDANDWKAKVAELYPEHKSPTRSSWANGVNRHIKEGDVDVHIPTSGGKPSIYRNLKKFPELSVQEDNVDDSLSVHSLSTT